VGCANNPEKTLEVQQNSNCTNMFRWKDILGLVIYVIKIIIFNYLIQNLQTIVIFTL